MKYLISDPSQLDDFREHHVCETWDDVRFEVPGNYFPPTLDNPIQVEDGNVLLTITALDPCLDEISN